MAPLTAFQDILDTYVANASALPLGKVGHFFERAYNATGDARYRDLIADYISRTKRADTESALSDLENPDFCFTKPPALDKNSPNALRNNGRKSFYRKHPFLSPLHRLTNNLFFLDKLGLRPAYGDLFERAIAPLLAHQSTAGILATPEGILVDSSYAPNTLFHLRALDVIDLTKELVSEARALYANGAYQDPSRLSLPELYSAFYTLTHLIIAASDFYEHAPAEDFRWIFAYFGTHEELARAKLSLDILAEIALCYRICGYHSGSSDSYRRYSAHVRENFRLEKIDDADYLAKKEHTASIVLLLLSPLERFSPGPDLSAHPLFV